MVTSKPQASQGKTLKRQTADIYAPKLATAARYRQASIRAHTRGDKYLKMAEALEAEAAKLKAKIS